MAKDMTKGKPLPAILRFCVPLLLGSLFQQFYNMADTIIVGRFVGVTELGAVGSTGSLNFLVIGFVIGICNGFCLPVSRSFGADDLHMMRKYVANAIYLCLFFAVILTVFTALYTRKLLILMSCPASMIDHAYNYISLIFKGIGVTIAYNLLACFLRALGDSKTPLYFLTVAAAINVALDILFIVVFKTGVAGAALATVISQSISVMLCGAFIWKKYKILRPSKKEAKPAPDYMRRQIGIGIPMALQYSITAIGSVMLQSEINKLPEVYISAVALAEKMQVLFTQPFPTVGVTLATYCSQNLGAKKLTRIKKGVQSGFILSGAYCVIAFSLMFFLGGVIAVLFIGDNPAGAEVIKNAHYYLRRNAVFYPFLALIFILRNSLQGLGYSAITIFAGLSELIARTSVAKIFVSRVGFAGACFAGPVAWIFGDTIVIIAFIVVMKKMAKMPHWDLSP